MTDKEADWDLSKVKDEWEWQEKKSSSKVGRLGTYAFQW